MSNVTLTIVRQNGSTKVLPNAREVAVLDDGREVVTVKGGRYAITRTSPTEALVDLRQPCVEAVSRAKKASLAAKAMAPVAAPKASTPKAQPVEPTPEVQAVLAMAGGNPAMLRAIYAATGQALKAAKRQ